MGVRGGDTLRPDGSILQVVLLDDHSQGGYPGAIMWHLGIDVAAVAAQRAVVTIGNNDPAGRKSVCVVDWIRYATAPASDVLINVGAPAGTAFPLLGPLSVIRDQGDQQTSPALQLLPNVGASQFNSGIVSGRDRIPTRDVLPHDITSPFTLAPQIALQLVTDVLNSAISVFFTGRYYPEQ